MAINDPGRDLTETRKPRIRALINGTDRADEIASFTGGEGLEGIIEADITNNNWYICDRFNLTLALLPNSKFDAKWWSNQTDVAVKLQIGYLTNGQPEGGANIDWGTVIQGGADQISVDPIQGIVEIEGRDLSYLLIESHTQEEFNNYTSSQVVTELAKRHDLTPVVTHTSTPVHRYYDRDHTKTTEGTFHRQTTEWDLCVFLAQNEQFDLYVSGRELHFQPKTPISSNPYILLFDKSTGMVRFNAINLHLKRAIILAKDIQVTVRSWSTKTNRVVEAVARKTGFGRVSAGGTSRAKGGASATQGYVYLYPGLTKDQAQRIAEQKIKDLTQHERVIEFDQPGVLTIDPRTKLRLQGTGTSWDQDYYVDHIRRRLSHHAGFLQTVRAKNVDASSQVTVE